MAQSDVAFEPVLHGHVPHEHGPTGSRAAHRGRGAGHPRSGEQGTVHLAQLDPPAAQLDLVVSAPDEHSPAASFRTRSPLRYARPQPREGIGAYFSASFTGSR